MSYGHILIFCLKNGGYETIKQLLSKQINHTLKILVRRALDVSGLVRRPRDRKNKYRDRLKIRKILIYVN